MKNDHDNSNPNNQISNMLIQLLHWLTLLELSGGHRCEHGIGQMMPESTIAVSIKKK